MQESVQNLNLEKLAIHASCQRLRLAGLTSQQYLCMPELLRIIKLLSGGSSSTAVEDVLQVPVSLWQAVVPQLLSLLVNTKVWSKPDPLNTADFQA